MGSVGCGNLLAVKFKWDLCELERIGGTQTMLHGHRRWAMVASELKNKTNSQTRWLRSGSSSIAKRSVTGPHLGEIEKLSSKRVDGAERERERGR